MPDGKPVVVATDNLGSVDWIAHDLSVLLVSILIFTALVAWMTVIYAALLKRWYQIRHGYLKVLGFSIFLPPASVALDELWEDASEALPRFYVFVYMALVWLLVKAPVVSKPVVQAREISLRPEPSTLPSIDIEAVQEPATIEELPPPRPTEISAKTRSTYLNLHGLGPGGRLPPEIEASLLKMELKNWDAKYRVPPEPWTPKPKGK